MSDKTSASSEHSAVIEDWVLIEAAKKLGLGSNDPAYLRTVYTVAIGGPALDFRNLCDALTAQYVGLSAEHPRKYFSPEESELLITYWQQGTALIQKCLEKAKEGDRLNAPIPLVGDDANLWHSAQLEAYCHALEMMGFPYEAQNNIEMLRSSVESTRRLGRKKV